jgi:hypothetical protein
LTIATVYLNEGRGHFFGYEAGHPLVHAASFDLDLSADVTAADGIPYKALGLVFRELNIDDPQQVWAIEYRRNRHRSLSVGDVVVVGEVAFTLTDTDWVRVGLRAEQIVAAGRAPSGGER